MVNWYIGIPVIGVLISGTFTAVSNKALYEYKSQGICGDYHGFEKPYFLTLTMFIGEALCLFAYYWNEWWKLESSKIWMSRVCCSTFYSYDADLARRRREREREAQAHGIEPYKEVSSPLSDDEMQEEDEEKSLLTGGASSTHPATVTASHTQLQQVGGDGLLLDQDLLDLHLSEEEQRRRREANKPSKFVYLGLCLFDLTASAAGGIGLVYIDASSNQMLRGSGVVFTALLSKVMLNRKLTLKQWMGVLSVCCGLALVGMCGLFRANSLLTPQATVPHNRVSPSGALLGLLLVLAGSALNAIQNIFEELLVKRVGNDSVDALELVGWEGVWGTLVTGLIVLPVVQYIPGSNCGSVENTSDTWKLLTSSSLIFFLNVGYALSISFLNAYSVILSKEVSAVFRQLVTSLRVVFIWVIAILMYYVWTHRTMGEGWDVYSWLQLGGFALLIIGTIIYGTKETGEEEPGVLHVDVNRPDTPPPEPKPSSTPMDSPDGSIDEYDEDGVRRTKDGIAISIGSNGSSRDRTMAKRSKSQLSRSPGIEAVPASDVRESNNTSSSTSGGSTSASRRSQASILMDEANSDLRQL